MLRVALAQLNLTVGDLDGNLARLSEAYDRAEAAGCDIVAFPELSTTGYPPEDLVLKPGFVVDNLDVLAKLAARTKSKNASIHPIDKKDEVVANAIWRFLELRGFLNSNHGHTMYARAMHASLKVARINDKFQDPLYLFLELVRAGVMHGNLWSGRAYSGGPSFGTDEQKKSMLLIMRVLSIVPLQSKVHFLRPSSRALLTRYYSPFPGQRRCRANCLYSTPSFVLSRATCASLSSRSRSTCSCAATPARRATTCWTSLCRYRSRSTPTPASVF